VALPVFVRPRVSRIADRKSHINAGVFLRFDGCCRARSERTRRLMAQRFLGAEPALIARPAASALAALLRPPQPHSKTAICRKAAHVS
jgi:hypothetical protein